MIELVALLCVMPIEPGRCQPITLRFEEKLTCEAVKAWLHTARTVGAVHVVDAVCLKARSS